MLEPGTGKTSAVAQNGTQEYVRRMGDQYAAGVF